MKKINHGQKDKGQILSKEKIIHQSFGGTAFHVVQKGKTIVLACRCHFFSIFNYGRKGKIKKKSEVRVIRWFIGFS